MPGDSQEGEVEEKLPGGTEVAGDGGGAGRGAGGGKVEGVDVEGAGEAGGGECFFPGAVTPAAVGGEFGGEEVAVEP